MFGSAVLDVAIGLFFIYLLVSIISSGLSEYIADRFFCLRAKNMKDALEVMLVGPQKDGSGSKTFFDDFFGSSLFNSLSQKNKLPSYMTSKRFKQVVIDVVTPDCVCDENGAFKTLRLNDLAVSINNLSDSHAKSALIGLLKQADNKIETFEKNIETWFDETMERASGWYKRKIRWFLFISAFCVSLGLNADTFQVISELSNDPDMRAHISNLAARAIEDKKIEDLQLANTQEIMKKVSSHNIIGWGAGNYQKSWDDMQTLEAVSFVLTKILGLFVTACAASLGAPFWFDLLNKLVNLRNAQKGQSAITKAQAN